MSESAFVLRQWFVLRFWSEGEHDQSKEEYTAHGQRRRTHGLGVVGVDMGLEESDEGNPSGGEETTDVVAE